MRSNVEISGSSEKLPQEWIVWAYKGNRYRDVFINGKVVAELIGIIGVPQKPLIVTEATPNINSVVGIETAPKRLSELFKWHSTDEATILGLDSTRIDRYLLSLNPGKGVRFGQDEHRAYFAQVLAGATSVGVHDWSWREMENKSLLNDREKEKSFNNFWTQHSEAPNQPISPLEFLSFPLILLSQK